ncbi:uncharacterized protein PFL1_00542 [Pseudozyma flocculosa PF-1]|uniref:Uncharacterized protein n=1 Tax=Pseudozyma flocculosa TaxID=84751 RepID=A0A5C3EQU8_9BASI|nr:uncharacterized protein PFL1_00542 [Pseudozyma flocculosa PF-1]EPQ32346.1 hypothetical protein PFL1_00542 [Pseudozyma flocculosa PF-1]SPO34693.1 uncharacterized protein PSFLO_00164 [Pseudozyma flocculosa]
MPVDPSARPKRSCSPEPAAKKDAAHHDEAGPAAQPDPADQAGTGNHKRTRTTSPAPSNEPESGAAPEDGTVQDSRQVPPVAADAGTVIREALRLDIHEQYLAECTEDPSLSETDKKILRVCRVIEKYADIFEEMRISFLQQLKQFQEEIRGRQQDSLEQLGEMFAETLVKVVAMSEQDQPLKRRQEELDKRQEELDKRHEELAKRQEELATRLEELDKRQEELAKRQGQLDEH